jgi:hypothetical protein
MKCHIHELKNVVTTVGCSTMLVEEDGAHPLVGSQTVVSLSRQGKQIVLSMKKQYQQVILLFLGT